MHHSETSREAATPSQKSVGAVLIPFRGADVPAGPASLKLTVTRTWILAPDVPPAATQT